MRKAWKRSAWLLTFIMSLVLIGGCTPKSVWQENYETVLVAESQTSDTASEDVQNAMSENQSEPELSVENDDSDNTDVESEMEEEILSETNEPDVSAQEETEELVETEAVSEEVPDNQVVTNTGDGRVIVIDAGHQFRATMSMSL